MTGVVTLGTVRYTLVKNGGKVQVLTGGAKGDAGGDGADGNTILYGSGAPSNALGVNGNFYIDTTAKTIYGPKAAGVWPSGTSLVGPQGPTGTVSSAGSIQFPATQVPSSDPNALDDYEEGTYTPSLLFGGGATSMAYTTREGSYTKVGRAVHFRAKIVLSAVGTDLGLATISLPFTAANSNNDTAVAVRASGMTLLSGPIQAYVSTAGSYVSLEGFNVSTGNAGVLTKSNFLVGSTVVVSGTYFV